jgi:hypothetical protein
VAITSRASRVPDVRLPRPRLTIRSVMVIVAVVALALAAEATRRRIANLSSAYRVRALEHQNKVELATLNAIDSKSAYRRGQPPDPKYAEWSARFRRLAEFHYAMMRKYERAASRPWIPIDSDPTPPQP